MFSHGGWENILTPQYVDVGIRLIGDAISNGDDSINPTHNIGGEAFTNDVFQMEAYCWCDGERAGHERQCPPNFFFPGTTEIEPVIIRWYKHSTRGTTINREVSREEWWKILRACMDSIFA